MNAARRNTSRCLAWCLLATISAFFLGLAQERRPSPPETIHSRIPWPSSLELHR